MHTTDRATKFALAAMFGFVIIDALVRDARQRRERFAVWRAAFTAQFEKTPGRVEWLRETLLREETVIKDRAASGDDCGCSDD